MKIILVLVISISLFSCTNQGVFEEKLSGNFFFENHGDDYKIITTHSKDNLIIYPNVVKYKYNTDFIVALQIINLNGLNSALSFEIREDSILFPNLLSRDIEYSRIKADSLIRNDIFLKKMVSQKVNYWIIAVHEKKIIGPLTKESYIDQIKLLSIPKSLVLE